MAVRPAAEDSCRGQVERSWDVPLRWREAGQERTGLSSRCGEGPPVAVGDVRRLWVRSDGVVTLDPPSKAQFAVGFVLVLDLLIGVVSAWAWLSRRPRTQT